MFIGGVSSRERLAKLGVPILRFSSGVPVGIPSSGSFGNNGALTLTTAFPTTFSGVIFLYFPADAIYVGSAAGFYYTVMSSTTAGTVYANMYTGGELVIPNSPTPLVCTGPGAYTQSTAEITLWAPGNLPAHVMGNKGILYGVITSQSPSNANTKSLILSLGSTTISSYNNGTNSYRWRNFQLSNQGSENVNIGSVSFNGYSVSSVDGFRTLAIDTGIENAIAITAQLSNSSDFILLRNAYINTQYKN